MDGILALYKERGMTSNDAVFKCRKLFKTRRVGHSGTLDPNVDGVLPICVGKATKVVNYLMDSGKVYMGQIILGFATETEDLDGAVVEQQRLVRPFSDQEIDQAMQALCGDLIQIPPMYSAIKVNGRRLYDYARKGEEVVRPKRQIHVDYFKQTKPSSFDEKRGQQTIFFEVGCGKGTYVRTLAVDLGKKLGVPAVMSDLTRLKSGGFMIGQAVSLAQLESLSADQLAQALAPIDHALGAFAHHELSEKQWTFVKNGGFLAPSYVNGGQVVPKLVLMYQGKARAVYKYNEPKARYQPEQMIDLS
ncbi:tRNA pseudouridine(55) synthase TruB [Ligilactobacillus agilis]|uniref:tRNA pseudouridine synthase B n=1 Tax=Ligilactobacillus agilis TaxID=1601 RepID=A0A231QG52_9LACO|nr:tRNA pseudouridine(55) synthase TruB [Ligilactobacillus agilis]OXC09263.1 tRNA pseudouridine(55) synthase TruB [Ligilactobacillus agilis]OXC10257.1 tRNA pseudouridine(55) synthase TruB [Ligilactobacillus agilis]OXC10975.1 tRNA pseudouridine(55) synthase TruB [Ligilactobacillus agilis]OXS38911.1 tRNA pseudouridine(55) synthase [Ligilactobacillus agilis]OXS39317.1 tRNA pseudouridine(55) synthase [Ligilactobacillus agilis]